MKTLFFNVSASCGRTFVAWKWDGHTYLLNNEQISDNAPLQQASSTKIAAFLRGSQYSDVKYSRKECFVISGRKSDDLRSTTALAPTHDV